jgi:two-component system, LytTR family, sensor kinase
MLKKEVNRLSVIFLAVVFFLEIVIIILAGASGKDILASLLFCPLYIAAFFFFKNGVFRFYFLHKKLFIAVLNFFIIAFTFYFFSYLVMVYLVGGLIDAGNPYYQKIRITDMQFVTNILMKLFTYGLFAYMFWTFEKLLMIQKEKAALNEQKLQVEYNYLKSQINPHFLYNTLSFFYSRMLKQDKQAANGIAALSDIMRYSLESGDNDGKVKLEQEVEQIENYILLQQLRFDQQLHINFKYNTPLPSVSVLPHIFITLVENAFKHGITDNPAHPLTILLQVSPYELSFSVQNRKSNKEKDRAPGGIGLYNLQERLKLTYPGKHEYNARDTTDEYSTNLKISI